jgi:glutamine---fructose-6-phosphate transaminase (isomerizing)
MCGITTILCKKNKKNAIELLMDSLYHLQNRGYDSFGLMTIPIPNKNSIASFDANADADADANANANANADANADDIIYVNKMACLTKNDTFEEFKERNIHIKSNIAVGHTRWATHGIISEKNAHPHNSFSNIFYLVHNGIIENYINLKNKLIKEKYNFYSDTDSEVIVNLIEYHYIILTNKYPKDNSNIYNAIINATNELEGTYGLVIQCVYDLDTVYIIRSGSPIIIGENENYIIATSETSGFINQIKTYHSLNDNNLLKLSLTEGIIMNEKPEYKNIHNNNIELTPYPYDYWLIKEIMEQNHSLLQSLNNGARITNDNKIKLGGVTFITPHINEIDTIILLGCGTSLNACHIASFYFKQLRCINNIYCFDAAEFSLHDLPLNSKSLIILCTQSGETMDLYRVLKLLKTTVNANYITMGIVNVVDSLIAREVDCGIYLNAGREVSVASTKSFTSSLNVLKLFSIWLYQQKYTASKFMNNIFQPIHNLNKQVETINKTINTIISNNHIDMLNRNNLFILGKGKMEYIAKETALKMKEICYIHAEGYSGSALKHGPFALLEQHFPVILIIDKESKEKMLNVYKEVECRGAAILVISEIIDLPVKNLINVPENNELQEILFILILQHISYKLSLLRGINPDKPRNLAKVVTVE